MIFLRFIEPACFPVRKGVNDQMFAKCWHWQKKGDGEDLFLEDLARYSK